MQIIEVDGTDVTPYAVDHLSLGVAQRYSVLVTARNATTSDYLFHANFDVAMFDTIPDGLVVNFTSTVSYGAGVVAAAEERDTLDRTPDHLLAPVVVEHGLDATRFITLGIFFDTFDNGVNRAAFNNITWQLPEVPSLFTALSLVGRSTSIIANAVCGSYDGRLMDSSVGSPTCSANVGWVTTQRMLRSTGRRRTRTSFPTARWSMWS